MLLAGCSAAVDDGATMSRMYTGYNPSPLFLTSPEDVSVRAAEGLGFAAVSSEAVNDGTRVTVSGAGAVEVAPDMARVTLGVTIRDANATQALTRNNELMDALISAVIELGISEEDIRTSSFNIWEAHDWVNSQRRFLGYEVSNNVTVTIRDISIVGDVLSVATEQGATMVGGVQFSIQDSTAAYHTALALAVQNATGKARAIAGALGMNYVVVVSITETGGFHQPIAQNFSMDMMVSASVAAEPASMSVPIQTGELSVSAQVQVVFSLMP